jgi:deoxycytidylate deaminase
MRFGSVLVKGGRIIGRGWNHVPTVEERAAAKLFGMSHVDYAIHAEQMAILDALMNGHDITGAKLFIIGYSDVPKTRGNLSVREGRFFTCKKCSVALVKFNVPVYIPHVKGWELLTPQEAANSAKTQEGYWTRFTKAKAA